MGSLRWTILATALLVVTVLGITLGETAMPLAEIWKGLRGEEGPAALTVRFLRAPRVLTALGAGACLGLSGALFQRLLRNPLASPDLMGFAPGAGLAMMITLAFGITLPPPLVSATGGVLAALSVAILAHRRDEGLAPLRLVLVGLGFGFTCSALAAFLMLTLPGPLALEAQRWLSGSLAARGWGHVAQIWLPGLILILLLVLQVRALSLLDLGDDLAQSLGLRAGRARMWLAATGVGLMAAGVAVAGPVAFVPLMAGPLGAAITGARRIGPALLAAALTGALITCGADLVARAAVPGVGLPLGLLTGLLGAPYLLWRLSLEIERGGL
ncbi:FecCD family ABC transporter permease [Gemmobacter serpentinus]|uniref:FecCD family ABC transporter permease n=1 Tax=Gemmobacter serpentinus TaxID=2652247 RepID=UPI00186570DB|nr:iron ABC transporter permease [Gemmobacter serpentinus]